MEKMHYLDDEDKLVIETIYDTTDTLEQNAAERNAAPEFGRYKPQFAGLVKIASLPMEHIVALKNKGYDLLSPNPDERRRALLYIQSEEPYFMTVPGKPVGRAKQKWS